MRTKVFVVGEHRHEDRVVQTFCELARSSGWSVLTGKSPSEAARESQHNDWLLACFEPGISDPPLEDVAATRANSILYAIGRDLSPYRAIEYCTKRHVKWIFNESEENHRAGDLKSRVHDLLDGRFPVTKIVTGLRRTRKISRGFVISSFASAVRDVNKPAIMAAARAHDLTCEYGDFFYSTKKSLSSKVRTHIIKSDVVFADVTCDSDTGTEQHNPNVYYEIGFAAGKNKPVVIMRDERTGRGDLPLDLREAELLRYWGSLDLALKLYFGLNESLSDQGPRPVILIIDDDGDAVEVLGERLRKQGYEVIGARSGPKAREVLNQEFVDLLIIDERLGRESGTTFFEQYSGSVTPHVAAVLLSGYVDKSVAIRAVNSGIARVVEKRGNVTDLLRAVAEVLEESFDQRLERRQSWRGKGKTHSAGY